MKLYPIDASRLQADPGKQALWFRGEQCELHIILTEHEVSSFNITIQNEHLEGGLNLSLRHGTLYEKDKSYKGSRLVDFDDRLPEELIKNAVDLVYGCTELEQSMQEGIMQYLSTKGEDSRGLENKAGYQSFQEQALLRRGQEPLSIKYGKKVLWACFFIFIGWQIRSFFDQDPARKEMLLGVLKGQPKDVAKGMRKVRKERRRGQLQENLSILESSCESGEIESCYRFLAISRKKGIDITGKLELLHQRACQADYGRGCVAIAEEYKRSENYKEAIKYYEKACNLKYRSSCELLQNTVKEFNIIKDCEAGRDYACYQAAEVMDLRGNYEKAVSFLKRNCHLKEGDHGESCGLLANINDRLNKREKARVIRRHLCLKLRRYSSCYFYIVKYLVPEGSSLGFSKKIKNYQDSCEKKAREEDCLRLIQLVEKDQPYKSN